MIGKLVGIIDYIESDHLLLNVNSIGYIIYCPTNFLFKVGTGDQVSLFINSQTREDGTYLYGFDSLELKKQFITLITVKGVGSKLGLSIISELGLDGISQAIFTQDKSAFQKVSGVGGKLAERIIVELKDKNAQLHMIENVHLAQSQNHDIQHDAVSALVNLGISKFDAYSKINKILSQNPEIKIDQLIAMSLRS